MPEHTHCWHRTSEVYTSLPPQWDEVCCWCGATQRVHEHVPDLSGHGPHVPDYRYPTAEEIGAAIVTYRQEHAGAD